MFTGTIPHQGAKQGYIRCAERASCIDRVYIGVEMGDGAVPKQAAAAVKLQSGDAHSRPLPPLST